MFPWFYGYRASPKSSLNGKETSVDPGPGNNADESIFVLESFKPPIIGEDPSFKTHKFSNHLQDTWLDWEFDRQLPKSRRVSISVYYPRFRGGRNHFTQEQLDTPYFVTKDWDNYYRPYYLQDKRQYCRKNCLWKAGFLERKVAKTKAKKEAYWSKMAELPKKPEHDSDNISDVDDGKMTLYSPPSATSSSPPAANMSHLDKFPLLTQCLKQLLNIPGTENVSVDQHASMPIAAVAAVETKPVVQYKQIEYEYKLPVGVDKDGEDFDFLEPSVGPPRAHYWTNVLFNEFFISRVDSPDNFFVQNGETALDLDKLNEWMTEWYDEYWPIAPTLRKRDITVRGFYAVYVEKYLTWFRCSIDDFVQSGGKNGEDEVVVILLDYGSMQIVQLDCILPLRKVYCELPIQAAKAKLQVKTVGKWTKEETKMFIKDVGGKLVQGLVLEQRFHRDEHLPELDLILFNITEDKECIYDLRGKLGFGYTDLRPPTSPLRVSVPHRHHQPSLPEISMIADFCNRASALPSSATVTIRDEPEVGNLIEFD